MVRHCLLLLVFAAARPAAAAPNAGHAEPGRYAVWAAKSAQILAARADANSLATAAALSVVGSGLKAEPSKSEPVALELAARAGELAPQNAAIGWLRLQLCVHAQSCDIRDSATTMRWLDPDNAAAWLPTLAVAQRDRDSTEVDRVLADMARVNRFDLYWNRVVVLMFDALHAARRELPGDHAASDSARYATVSGIAGGEVIPTFAPLVDACRESATLPERRDLCLKVSKTMQRSDTILAQITGFSIERHMLAPDSKEARAIAERRHALEWRVAAAAKFDSPSPLLPWTKNAHVRVRLARMRAIPREEDVCIAILREHGIALEPPEMHP